MGDAPAKEELKIYLDRARDGLLFKLDGLSEYDLRRPLVPTGTNLLGLVKHCACVEWGYFRLAFDLSHPPIPGWEEAEPEANIDMYAGPDESREQILEFYNAARAAADETIDELSLDTTGTVPWWPEERRHPSLHRLMVAVIAEVSRHAGHADLTRELIDGAAGIHPTHSNLPDVEGDYWRTYVDTLEEIAATFR